MERCHFRPKILKFLSKIGIHALSMLSHGTREKYHAIQILVMKALGLSSTIRPPETKEDLLPLCAWWGFIYYGWNIGFSCYIASQIRCHFSVWDYLIALIMVIASQIIVYKLFWLLQKLACGCAIPNLTLIVWSGSFVNPILLYVTLEQALVLVTQQALSIND